MFLAVKFIDIVLILIIVFVLAAIIYFNFIRHHDSPCHNCGEKKRCFTGDEVVKYYKECKCKEENKDK